MTVLTMARVIATADYICYGYVGGKEAESIRVKHWEIIAYNLSKAGWSWGCVSAINANGQTIWIPDAHRDDGKRFVVRTDEKLTAFLELESAIRAVSY